MKELSRLWTLALCSCLLGLFSSPALFESSFGKNFFGRNPIGLEAAEKTLTKKNNAPNADAKNNSGKKPLIELKKARRSPDWVQNGIVYQINTRAFTPEGTVRGAQKKLPILKEAGVTILYFCPLFLADDDMRQEYWSPRQVKSGLNNPRNPYRLKDYDRIDPEYGTEAEVKEFVKAAHDLGMHVIFDLVYLHCGPTGVLVKSHPEYFLYSKNGEMKMTIWHFPMFDFQKQSTREYFWKNMEKWVRDCDIDGYRCDVSDGIPLDFWCEGRRRLEKIKPEIALLAEGQKRVEDQIFAFDMNYNFSFASLLSDIYTKDKKASEARKMLEKMSSERPRGFRFIRYIDNHDISNDDYDRRKDTQWGVDGVDAALVFLYALDGVPMLYCGQEIADISRHSLYGSKTFGNCIIDWKRLDQPLGKKRMALCAKLSQMRRSDPIFSQGETIWLDNDQSDSVLSFLRQYNDQKILVAVNMKPQSVQVEIKDYNNAQGTVLLSKTAKNSGNASQKQKLDLPPYGYLIQKLK